MENEKDYIFLMQIVEDWQRIWSRWGFQCIIGHDDIYIICRTCFVNKKSTNGYRDL